MHAPPRAAAAACRRVRLLGGRDVILSDTVGFISGLPTQLVEAFKVPAAAVELLRGWSARCAVVGAVQVWAGSA